MITSVDLAKEMQKLFPNECRVIKVKMLYEKEIKKYLKQTEDAHKKAAKSTLQFD